MQRMYSVLYNWSVSLTGSREETQHTLNLILMVRVLWIIVIVTTSLLCWILSLECKRSTNYSNRLNNPSSPHLWTLCISGCVSFQNFLMFLRTHFIAVKLVNVKIRFWNRDSSSVFRQQRCSVLCTSSLEEIQHTVWYETTLQIVLISTTALLPCIS